jgi:hypothetical protein
VYDSVVEIAMADIRLTREERTLLRERISDAAHERAGGRRHGGMGLAEAAMEAAGGDGLYALYLAVEFVHRHPGHGGRALATKIERRRSPRRIAYEELIDEERTYRSAAAG